MEGQWKASRRPVEGQWEASGRPVEGRWKVSGRPVEGQWKAGGRPWKAVEGPWKAVEEQRHLALAAEADEVCALDGAFGEEHAVVGDDADLVAVDPSEAAHERAAVLPLELVELRRVEQPREQLAHVERLTRVARHEAVQLRRREERRGGRGDARERGRGRRSEVAHHLARDA